MDSVPITTKCRHPNISRFSNSAERHKNPFQNLKSAISPISLSKNLFFQDRDWRDIVILNFQFYSFYTRRNPKDQDLVL